jgi:broad specificity phosphatase PhoE
VTDPPLASRGSEVQHPNPTASTTGLWLVRHGETEWSAAGRHTGRTDVALTDAGVAQAEALGRRLDGRAFTLVLTSPMARAAETCRIAGYGDVAQTTADLCEWDYGDYEGKTTADIRRDRSGWTLWSGGVPGGETAPQVAGRARRVIDVADRAGGEVALFAHGHVLRVLTATWLGLDPTAGRLLALDTATLSVLGYERETRVVRAWNWRADAGNTG